MSWLYESHIQNRKEALEALDRAMEIEAKEKAQKETFKTLSRKRKHTK